MKSDIPSVSIRIAGDDRNRCYREPSLVVIAFVGRTTTMPSLAPSAVYFGNWEKRANFARLSFLPFPSRRTENMTDSAPLWLPTTEIVQVSQLRHYCRNSKTNRTETEVEHQSTVISFNFYNLVSHLPIRSTPQPEAFGSHLSYTQFRRDISPASCITYRRRLWDVTCIVNVVKLSLCLIN
jgi:hypothetical protein